MTGGVVVEGDGPLSAAIVERLQEEGAAVQHVLIARPSQASAAHLEAAAVLVLAGDDDARNVELALWARRVRPDLRLVARIFDNTLADYLAGSVDRLTILSMSQVAAPVLSEAALRAFRSVSGAASAPPGRRRRLSVGGKAPRIDRVLLGALLGLALVVVTATIYFAHVLELRAMDALYFVWTTVMTVGYGDISLQGASTGAKVVGMVLMLAGAAFIATLFAFLTGWVVTRRLDVLRGRIDVRGRDHVVVVGAGNVGLRAAQNMRRQGHRVVIIERDGESRNVAALRLAGHHVIVADATNDHTLELARVQRAGVVIVVTDSDAVNLQIALLVRIRSTVPVVMRLVSPELSLHVTRRGDAIALSPIAVAAQAFTAAVLNERGDSGAAARP